MPEGHDVTRLEPEAAAALRARLREIHDEIDALQGDLPCARPSPTRRHVPGVSEGARRALLRYGELVAERTQLRQELAATAAREGAAAPGTRR